MSTELRPNYGKFGSGSRGPEGLYIGHYAKHEIWVRWLTAQAELAAKEKENERLRQAVEDYLLWRPGEKGFAAAHHELARTFARLDAANDKEPA